MEQMTKETSYKSGRLAQWIVGYIFGAIGLILILRFLFKLFGANSDNGFVSGIYSISNSFVKIFEGIFDPVTIDNFRTNAIFEPATLIAMVIIGIIAWIVIALISPNVSRHTETAKYTTQSN